MPALLFICGEDSKQTAFVMSETTPFVLSLSQYERFLAFSLP